MLQGIKKGSRRNGLLPETSKEKPDS